LRRGLGPWPIGKCGAIGSNLARFLALKRLPEKVWNYFPNRLELFPTALLNVVIKQQETFFGEMTMSTHAVIANVNPDGRCQAVYLHYDGYPEYAGRILNQRYETFEKAQTLVAGGELRSLPDKTEEPSYFENGEPTRVVDNAEALMGFAQSYGVSYLYLFANDRWHCWQVP
jgi:hypothetical protein